MHRLGGDAFVAQRSDRGAPSALGDLLAVRPEHEPVVDVLGRRAADHVRERPVQLLVWPVIVSPQHVGDREVEIVDDAREVVGRTTVLAQERHPLEALGQPRGGLAVAILALALAHRALVPDDPQPAQIGEDRLLATGKVSGRVGIVDAQQHRPGPGEIAIGDGAERVPDVQRAGRARGEADLHPPESRRAPPLEPSSSLGRTSSLICPSASVSSLGSIQIVFPFPCAICGSTWRYW